ncbi:MAG TPA: GPR1/FUN34/YaaH family transporter [Actinospica sp.]|jgi:hypothetical protein|nr:GPR1/FUN34/YaaH family transporter [Actinospica sp.]
MDSSAGQVAPRGQSGRAAQGPPVSIVLRPLASSAPLAFFSFAVGTVLYSSLQLQWVPQAETRSLAITLLAFVAPLQLFSGALAFAARDTGMATTMMIFGGVWVALALSMLNGAPGSRTTLLGIMELTVAVVVAALGAAAVRAKPLLAGLALLAFLRYALGGVYEVTSTAGTQRAAGWLGLPTALVALYGGLAFLLEDTAHRTVLPLGRRAGASLAVEGDLSDQVRDIDSEAGVRQQM